ncbi:MAG TPA: flavin reductase [Tenuifilaceae bacterium]|nr:flavin reductase [Tenuifilaceae bacterium]HPE19088.1 flavin reductase [Tenuifilaceae bacterium]HPJ46597.1 flavin reductase [Tenuifilaceae bacterium]HPQ34967.1 flavin reductase [Tenuifilaceae bacterium]HRX68755.1 flavin reductase [Tenuifilaceae bacterium]
MHEFLGFEPRDVFTLSENIFTLLDKDWMLVTAGNRKEFNTMTASWGGFGILWRKPVTTIYVRPQRYTYQFVEREAVFSLSFFGKEYRKALNICGTKSGRDCNKVFESGLSPVLTPGNCVAFKEARIILECRKLYADNIEPQFFVDNDIDEAIYPTKDYHRFYIAEILRYWHKES